MVNALGDREDFERLGRLPSEVKVSLAIGMTDAMVAVCAAGIRAQYPTANEEEVMDRLRERLAWMKRRQKRRRPV